MGTDIHGLQVRIASPCGVAWESMGGGERVRFCAMCRQRVYDLTGLTRAQVLELFERQPSPCVRYFAREDGTVLTADCPIGERLALRARAWARARTAALSVLVAAGIARVLSAAGLSRPDAVERAIAASIAGDRDVVTGKHLSHRVPIKPAPLPPLMTDEGMRELQRQREALFATVVMGKVAGGPDDQPR